MQINIDNINRQAWFAIAAMLVIYLILVLEDVVEALKKRTVLVMKVYEDAPPMKIIGSEPVDYGPDIEPMEIPPLKSAENSEK